MVQNMGPILGFPDREQVSVLKVRNRARDLNPRPLIPQSATLPTLPRIGLLLLLRGVSFILVLQVTFTLVRVVSFTLVREVSFTLVREVSFGRVHGVSFSLILEMTT